MKVPLFTKIVPNVIASTPIIETALGISSIPKRHPKTYEKKGSSKYALRHICGGINYMLIM